MGEVEATRGDADGRGRPGLLDRLTSGRPLTALAVLAMAGYSFWEGFILDHVTINMPPSHLTGYAGPVTLGSLRAWAFAYLGLGFLFLARLPLLRAPKVDFAAHLVCMVPITAWAAGFDVGGSPTTGQPAYTFIAVFLFVLPFITRIIERWQKHLETLR